MLANNFLPFLKWGTADSPTLRTTALQLKKSLFPEVKCTTRNFKLVMKRAQFDN